MKKAYLAALVSVLVYRSLYAEGWLDSIKSLFGIESSDSKQVTEQLNAQGLLSALTNLNISSDKVDLAQLCNTQNKAR